MSLAVALFVASSVAGLAGKLANGGFEQDLGSRDQLNVWGDYGDIWGGGQRVAAGPGQPVKKAHGGERLLLINIAPDSWNGAWQQIKWDEKRPFAWSAYYLIKGDLPTNCSTFMKIEFYDANDAQIGSVDGDRHRADTRGQWIQDSMKGQTPAGAAAIRFILIAGDNTGGATNIENRIFWDDAESTP